MNWWDLIPLKSYLHWMLRSNPSVAWWWFHRSISWCCTDRLHTRSDLQCRTYQVGSSCSGNTSASHWSNSLDAVGCKVCRLWDPLHEAAWKLHRILGRLWKDTDKLELANSFLNCGTRSWGEKALNWKIKTSRPCWCLKLGACECKVPMHLLTGVFRRCFVISIGRFWILPCHLQGYFV